MRALARPACGLCVIALTNSLPHTSLFKMRKTPVCSLLVRVAPQGPRTFSRTHQLDVSGPSRASSQVPAIAIAIADGRRALFTTACNECKHPTASNDYDARRGVCNDGRAICSETGIQPIEAPDER